MKYWRQNRLVIDYPSPSFQSLRRSWAIAWTELRNGEKVRFIQRGDRVSSHTNGKTSKKNMILVDLDCNKKEFLRAIIDFFSDLLDVNPYSLRFRFERFQPFGNLNNGE